MKKTVYGCVAACAAALIVWSGSCSAVEQAAAVGIDPEASAIIKALSEGNQRIGNVRFKVYDTSDEVTDSGEMIQYAHVRTVTLRRPDRLWMETRGDKANTSLWYDGAMFTLLDRDKNVYVQLKAPATLDETIDFRRFNRTLQESSRRCAARSAYGTRTLGTFVISGSMACAMTTRGITPAQDYLNIYEYIRHK